MNPFAPVIAAIIGEGWRVRWFPGSAIVILRERYCHPEGALLSSGGSAIVILGSAIVILGSAIVILSEAKDFFALQKDPLSKATDLFALGNEPLRGGTRHALAQITPHSKS